MKAYSVDLRAAALAAVDRGMPRAAAAAAFGIAPATLKRWLRQRRRTGSLRPRPIPGRPARLGAVLDAGLEPQLRAAPDAAIAEHGAAWAERAGQAVSPSTMRRAIARSGWTRKKRP